MQSLYKRHFPESVLTTSVQVDTDDNFVNDEKILRTAIASELSAINLYQDLLVKVNHDALRVVLQDIIDEEKVHVSEFTRILSRFIDKDYDELEIKGAQEADEVVSEKGTKVEESYVRKFKEYRTFKNKKEFVDFIKHQTNITLENDENDLLNKKRNILYTKIDRDDGYKVFPLIYQLGLRFEEHHKDYFWIYIK